MSQVIQWDPRTNCITEWSIENWPHPLCLTGWGCEVGNWFGFFAQERLGGNACRINRCYIKPVHDNRLESSWSIFLPHASLNVHVLDEVVEVNRMVRRLTIVNDRRETSWIGDLVIRSVVPWEPGLVAEIEGQMLEHQDNNFYYDTEELVVGLRWPDGRQLLVKWLEAPDVPPAFTHYLYIRAQPAMPWLGHKHCMARAWVVHARLLVDYPAAFVYRYARNPFVFWDRGLIGRFFIRPQRLGHRWRAGEWKQPGRGSLMGLWPLCKGQALSLSIEMIAKIVE